MDFSKITDITISEGSVIRILDTGGTRTIWEKNHPVITSVLDPTSTTSTTYDTPANITVEVTAESASIAYKLYGINLNLVADITDADRGSLTGDDIIYVNGDSVFGINSHTTASDGTYIDLVVDIVPPTLSDTITYTLNGVTFLTVTLHRSDISAEDGTPVITAVFGTAVSDGNAYLDLHSKDDISFEANDTYTISFSGKYLNKISTVTKYAGLATKGTQLGPIYPTTLFYSITVNNWEFTEYKSSDDGTTATVTCTYVGEETSHNLPISLMCMGYNGRFYNGGTIDDSTYPTITTINGYDVSETLYIHVKEQTSYTINIGGLNLDKILGVKTSNASTYTGAVDTFDKAQYNDYLCVGIYRKSRMLAKPKVSNFKFTVGTSNTTGTLTFSNAGSTFRLWLIFRGKMIGTINVSSSSSGDNTSTTADTLTFLSGTLTLRKGTDTTPYILDLNDCKFANGTNSNIKTSSAWGASALNSLVITDCTASLSKNVSHGSTVSDIRSSFTNLPSSSITDSKSTWACSISLNYKDLAGSNYIFSIPATALNCTNFTLAPSTSGLDTSTYAAFNSSQIQFSHEGSASYTPTKN